MSESSDELRSRVAALEAENAALRAGEHSPARSHHRSRAVLAAVMVVLGVLLAPVAVVTGWAQWTLTDTDRFVATYAPLAHDPAVQDYVVDQTMAVIDQRVDFDQLTSDLVDGLISLGTGPRATSALRTLQGSVADGLRSQVRDGVTAFVSSERFATAWSDALRVGHQQLDATMQNDPSAVATISADGSLGIPLDPIVERIKDDLVARGVTVAQRIPPVHRNIVLVQSDLLPQLQVAYAATVALGSWLPWVVLALLVGGVAVANHRPRTLLATAAAFAGAMAVLAVAIAAGRVALVAAVPATLLPGAVTTLFYDAATTSMRSTAVAATVLGVSVAVVGWLAGPFRVPTRLRGLYLDAVQRLRETAEQRGVTTGRFGDWVHRRRSLLLALVAVAAGVVLVAGMPVSISLVGWTALWSTLAVVALTVIERPAAPVSP